MDALQLGFSFVAIVLLALVAGWLFPVRQRLTAERAERNLVRCYPNLVPDGAIIGADGLSALVPIKGNSQVIGFITQLGDRVVARLISHDDIADVKEHTDRIDIHFDDFTQPAARIFLSAFERDKAHKLLKNIMIKVIDNAA